MFSLWVKGTRQLLMAAETIPQCVVEQISETLWYIVNNCFNQDYKVPFIGFIWEPGDIYMRHKKFQSNETIEYIFLYA